jgi:L-asparagine transporter-like permease
LAIFLKIGFPILAILIGICLALAFIFTIKYGNKCSKDNHSAARITVYATLTILTILFLILFVMGILTRKTVVMAIGIPILCLVFITIVTIICLSIKRREGDPNRSSGKSGAGTETELQDLQPKNPTRNTELPSYEDAMNT